MGRACSSGASGCQPVETRSCGTGGVHSLGSFVLAVLKSGINDVQNVKMHYYDDYTTVAITL